MVFNLFRIADLRLGFEESGGGGSNIIQDAIETAADIDTHTDSGVQGEDENQGVAHIFPPDGSVERGTVERGDKRRQKESPLCIGNMECGQHTAQTSRDNGKQEEGADEQIDPAVSFIRTVQGGQAIG